MALFNYVCSYLCCGVLLLLLCTHYVMLLLWHSMLYNFDLLAHSSSSTQLWQMGSLVDSVVLHYFDLLDPNKTTRIQAGDAANFLRSSGDVIFPRSTLQLLFYSSNFMYDLSFFHGFFNFYVLYMIMIYRFFHGFSGNASSNVTEPANP